MESRRLQVLLIDPFRDEGDLYALYFGTKGLVTDVQHDAEEGIRRAIHAPPDVVVTRLRQDGPLTGIDVIEQLRAHAATRDLPIVVITTSIRASDREAALAAGCDAYVLLPVKPEQVLTVLCAALDARRRTRRPAAAAGPSSARTDGYGQSHSA